MIKVIGTDTTKVMVCTCSGCASILEYTDNDTGSYIASDHGGSTGVVVFINCPSCQKQIILKSF